MSLTANQQAKELINRAKRILLVTKQHATLDALASVTAMGRFLQKMNKPFEAVVPDVDLSHVPRFLSVPFQLRANSGALRALHIKLNVKDKPLTELSYDVKDGMLDITLVPGQTEWNPQDVTFRYGEDRYDLIIAFDCPDQASLGALARDQAEFLYRTTIVNIDASAANEYWGQVNLVDLNSVSTTEIVYGLLDEWNRASVDEPIATALLAGMIEKTKSFRTPNVSPRTLAASSALITMGAKRQEIVHGLWRTRTVSTLKLWGRALTRLEQDRAHGLVWTTLAEADFIECGATPDALEGVVDELISYSQDAKAVVLAYVNQSTLMVSLHVQAPLSAAELARPFGGTGTRERAVFPFRESSDLQEGTAKIIERLKESLRTVA